MAQAPLLKNNYGENLRYRFALFFFFRNFHVFSINFRLFQAFKLQNPAASGVAPVDSLKILLYIAAKH